MQRLSRLVASAAALLFLAACGGPSGHLPGVISVSVELPAETFRPASLQPAGVPNDPSTGLTGVERVEVSVTDKNGDPVSFVSHGDYTFVESGGVDHVLLTAISSSAQLTLPAALAPYSFQSLAYDDTSGGSVIAFEPSTSVGSLGDDVQIELTSVLAAAILTPRLPTNAAVPGQVLDLMLHVAANGNADFEGKYLRVPITDFAATYTQLENVNTQAEWMTDMGIRVTVSASCSGSVIVGGNVDGYLDNNPVPTMGSLTISGSGYELECAHVSGEVFTDLELPTGDIDSYDAGTGQVQGSAGDDYGVAKVRIYDGPVLMASDDSIEAAASGVSLIVFSGNDFTTTLETTPVGGLTLVVVDTSGNTFSSDETFDPDNVYVDDDAPAGGDGGRARPFNTIAEGLDAVAVGGTVWIAPGVYVGAVYVQKTVTIRGPNHGIAPWQADRGPEAVMTGPVCMSANEVVLTGLRIEFDPSTVTAAPCVNRTIAVEQYGGWDGVVLSYLAIIGPDSPTPSNPQTMAIKARSGNANFVHVRGTLVEGWDNGADVRGATTTSANFNVVLEDNWFRASYYRHVLSARNQRHFIVRNHFTIDRGNGIHLETYPGTSRPLDLVLSDNTFDYVGVGNTTYVVDYSKSLDLEAVATANTFLQGWEISRVPFAWSIRTPP